uniref:EGF-like domain-containing protein n=1 Tax=Timema bartmani TaxID=61472 RepID=A0A7R9F1X9_9NEOP|nr:unnamed protein product [Timema bartmani]
MGEKSQTCAVVVVEDLTSAVSISHGSSGCMCSPGYTGQNCENKYVPCDPSPCLNDGLCRQVDSLSYECQCPPALTADGRMDSLTNSDWSRDEMVHCKKLTDCGYWSRF